MYKRQGLAGPQTLNLTACVMFQGADIAENNQEHFDKAFSKARELLEDIGIRPVSYTHLRTGWR